MNEKEINEPATPASAGATTPADETAQKAEAWLAQCEDDELQDAPKNFGAKARRRLAGGKEAWSVRFANPESALFAAEARGDALFAVRSADPERRRVALELIRRVPWIACGWHREWTDMAEAARAALKAGDEPPAKEVLSALGRIGKDAVLGPWLTEEEKPKEGRGVEPALRVEEDAWAFEPNGHWLLDAMLFGDIEALRALLEAGVDPNIERFTQSAAEHEAKNAELASRGCSPHPRATLKIWNYCVSLLEMGPDELIECEVGATEEEAKDWSHEEKKRLGARVARGVLEILTLALSHGLDPAARDRVERTWMKSCERALVKRLGEGKGADAAERLRQAVEARALALSLGEDAGRSAPPPKGARRM
jgi:hypothetical protein